MLRFLTEQSIYSIPKSPRPVPNFSSWNTGKDMVYMAGTRQGGGNLVFALLKDAAGQYSIYGITAGQYQDSPVQSTYMDIDAAKAPGLANAICFAFHPTLPFLIYNSGNEVYLIRYVHSFGPAGSYSAWQKQRIYA